MAPRRLSALAALAAWSACLAPGAAGAAGPLNSLREISAAVTACYAPPPPALARPGTQITVLFTLKANGDLLGRPRVTFRSPGLSPEQQDAYFKAVALTLRRCLPLALTQGLGQAVAGRPMTIRFLDKRNLRRA